MYHISDCKKYSRCARLFVLENAQEKQEYRPYVRLDEEITLLAAEKLGVTHCFKGERGDSAEKALEAMKSEEWLLKARFEYRNLRVKIPFLHRNGDGWDVYFLFAGLYPRADDLQFYCNTAWVLAGNGINMKNWYVIHLNASYVRGETLDPNALFVISRNFYNSKGNPSVPVGETILKNMRDLSGDLAAMDRCLHEEIPAPVRTNACTGRTKCRHYNECFEEEKRQDDNSIVHLIGAQHRYAMLKEGRTRLRDADPARIEGSRQQFAQIIADGTENGLFADRMALHAWLEDITYPVTFLDFEWERFAVPPYPGMKPYDVLPFEYSIDILHENGERDHKVFLSVGDDRLELAENLVKDIPRVGTVIAYNAEGAEKIRIRELAALFPKLREELLDINERMEDLQLPFESGTVYDVRMRGQWSLKMIMSMMDDPGYHDLDIQQGMDAVFQWRYLDLDGDIENKEEIIENLKAYCGMDSYAMTVVYEWLRKIDSSPVS